MFLEIHRFGNVDLCPVRVLECDLSKTKHLRKSDQLLCYIQSYFNKYCCKMAKMFLFYAGIDVNISKAHSFKSASASAAYSRGCSLSQILKAADWSSPRNFRQLYL